MCLIGSDANCTVFWKISKNFVTLRIPLRSFCKYFDGIQLTFLRPGRLMSGPSLVYFPWADTALPSISSDVLVILSRNQKRSGQYSRHALELDPAYRISCHALAHIKPVDLVRPWIFAQAFHAVVIATSLSVRAGPGIRSCLVLTRRPGDKRYSPWPRT